MLGSAGALFARTLFKKNQGATAVVSVGGRDVLTVDLAEDADPYEIDLSPYGVGVILEVREHTIRFQRSDCPDQICVHTGRLSGDTDIAICMPNQTAVMMRTAPAS